VIYCSHYRNLFLINNRGEEHVSQTDDCFHLHGIGRSVCPCHAVSLCLARVGPCRSVGEWWWTDSVLRVVSTLRGPTLGRMARTAPYVANRDASARIVAIETPRKTADESRKGVPTARARRWKTTTNHTPRHLTHHTASTPLLLPQVSEVTPNVDSRSHRTQDVHTSPALVIKF
jgi:hypothetical protein